MFVKPSRLTALAICALSCTVMMGGQAPLEASAARSAVPGAPNPGAANRLYGVSAVSPTMAWAAGLDTESSHSKTFVLRWNGSSWSRSTSPSPGTDASLAAVSADAAGDAWAVGFFIDASGGWPLILHWNGTDWSQSATPALPTGSRLMGVSALSPTDVWAVGRTDPPNPLLILHWDGSTWAQEATPPLDGGELSAVSARSSTDVWAVGDSAPGGNLLTLALHWDGSLWQQVATPSPTSISTLDSVSVLSASNAWAAGVSQGATAPLVEHWNGTTWKVVTVPAPPLGASLTGIQALSPKNVWAVGSYVAHGPPLSRSHSFTAHRVGRNWSQVQSPAPGRNSYMFGLSLDGPDDGWAAGYYVSSTNKQLVLLARWDGTAWSLG
jgi:hypothetical protein